MEILGLIVLIYVLFPLIILLLMGLFQNYYIWVILLVIVVIYCSWESSSKKIRLEKEKTKKEIWYWCKEHDLDSLIDEDDFDKYELLLQKYNIKGIIEKKKFEKLVKDAIFDCNFVKQMENEMKEKAEKEYKNYIEFSKKVYCKCVELNVDINNDIDSIEIIASSFNVDKSQVKKMYNDAKQDIEFEKKKQEEIKKIKLEKERIDTLNKQINEEFKIINKDKELSMLQGKDRYYFRFNSKEYCDKFEIKLYDDRNQEKLKDLIDIKAIDYRILDTNNFIINLKMEYINDIKILDKSAVLDGSFKINILDDNNNVVALGYLNGEYNNVSTFGFYKQMYSVLCGNTGFYEVNKNFKYKVIIEPVRLWLIEK